MSDYQSIVNQIPIQYNFLSFLAFTGIVLGLMVSIILFSKKTSENRSIFFFAAVVLCLVFILTDFFLSQTGLLKYVIRLNNSTEAFALLIPIFAYFFIFEILNPEKRSIFDFARHLVLPCLYLLVQMTSFFQPKVLFLNAYTSGFHPHLPMLEHEISNLYWWAEKICSYFHHFLVATFLLYLFLSIKIIQAYNEKIIQQFSQSKPNISKYHFSVYLVILLAISVVVLGITYMVYESDLGEQYVMSIPLAGIYALSFLMMSGAPVFDKTWLLEKYHTSGLNISSSKILEKIIFHVETEKYYLKKASSLKDLAAELSLSSTYLSQIINSQTQQNFSDFINQYRVEEVKKRLTDEAYSHLSIAGIGESVGFNSKSSFYTVFKKHTHLTPTAYIKATKSSKKP